MAKSKSNNKKNTKGPQLKTHDSGYYFAMSYNEGIDTSSTLLYMLPIIFFSSVVILMVRMKVFYRPMSQFYWSAQSDDTQISDFFSHIKMEFILGCAILAILMILFNVTRQAFAVKRTWLFFPMIVYSVFVLLSYFTSDYKEFALLGWDGRFEGTLTLLAYMIMLFLIINAVNTEQNVKQLLWPLGVSSAILGLLGVTQALDRDFFRTVIGQKLIVPNSPLENGGTFWQSIDEKAAVGEQALNFTFQNREIYQTVYNINYVSFYLTLLIPLFAMLFIRALLKESGEPLWKKILLGSLLALLIFNFIGSASSGGFVGLGVIGIMAIILLNKRILKLWKPILVILLILAIVLAGTYSRWWPEVSGAVKSVLNIQSEETVEDAEEAPAEGHLSKIPTIEYFKTEGMEMKVSLNGEELTIGISLDENGNPLGIYTADSDGNLLDMVPDEELAAEFGETTTFCIEDPRFHDYVALGYNTYTDAGLVLTLHTSDERFMMTTDGYQMLFFNQIGKTTTVDKVEAVGFENNYAFGSGRGYIWSRSIPLLKDNLITGVGADCYCAVFPQNDYAGRYTTKFFDQNIIVDKPHNMYLHMGICTGCISLLAILVLYGAYIVQSFKLLWKRDFGTDYLTYAAAGIFFGTTAFMFTGLVDDSSVSVMPMFYTMLGTGIAINLVLKRRDELGPQAKAKA